MSDTQYKVIKINRPGRINTLLDGYFHEFNLYDCSQQQLKQLYERGCRFVGLTDTGVNEVLKQKPITVKKLKK